MLTYKIKPGNTKMLYWLPGRNDLFMHYAAAEAFLDAGYDVFVMEHRRLGRVPIATRPSATFSSSRTRPI